METEPRLYGIANSNREGDDLWGKNQFNSTFPVSLSCYMRDKGIKAVYIKINEDLKVVVDDISIEEIFNVTEPNEKINFLFETKYEPYQMYAYDDIGHIDLVIKEGERWCRALEIKLTVLPDQATHHLKKELWSSELVLRPVTTRYAAMSIADSCKNNFEDVRYIIEPSCKSISDWGNIHEITANKKNIIDSLNDFQQRFCHQQKPFLLQPIWKTTGKQPWLDENAFDVFVWSDYALCRTFLDRSSGDSVSRYLRSSARLARILYDLSTRNITNISQIYANMTFNYQTDKEFSLSGRVTRDYLRSPRRTTPLLKKDIIKDLILGGGELKLSPERRFDQTIYFSAQSLFEKKRKSTNPS
jgi:hypothetical protein